MFVARAPEILGVVGRRLSQVRFPGKWRTINALGGLRGRVCPETHCLVGPGAKITVRLTDRIERLMWAGCYERDLSTIMAELLAPGMTFVDVGAHIGYFTALAAVLVGTEGRVHAFEADPDCFQRLTHNAASLLRVYCHQFAVADMVGSAAFYRSPKSGESGWGSLLRDGEVRVEINAQATTLDLWAKERGVERVDFIKIDAEGGEYRVLRGAQSVLRRHRPALFMEVNEICLARDGRTPSDLVAIVQSHSYRMAALLAPRTKKVDSFLAVPVERARVIGGLKRRGIELTLIGESAEGSPLLPS